MMPRLTLMLFILLVSCHAKNKDWQTLDFGNFTIKTPPGWTTFKEKGVDSYAGGLTNGRDSLWFDYGWYSGELGYDDHAIQLYGQDTINGLLAAIKIPKEDGKGQIMLAIPHVNEKDKFSLGGHNIKGTNTILEMFKSVVFRESDTTKNGVLVWSKFKSYPHGSGSTVMEAYCASCHNPVKTGLGPAYRTITARRDYNWIYRFLTNRKSIVADSIMKADIREADGMKCMEYTDLSPTDIELLLSYFRNKYSR